MRIRAPVGLFLTRRFDQRREPTLRVLRHNLAHLSQLAGAHECAGLLYERVATVIVRQREHHVVLSNESAECLRVLERCRHRLVADHMDAALDERPRDTKMQVVGRHDGYEIDALALGQRRLALRHRVVALVDSLWIEMELSTLHQ